MAVKPTGCGRVPAELITHILDKPERGWAEKPKHRPIDAASALQRNGSDSVWYVVIKFRVDGGEQPGEHVAVWGMKSLHPSDDIVSVDGTAASFTGWPTPIEVPHMSEMFAFNGHALPPPQGFVYCVTGPTWRGGDAVNESSAPGKSSWTRTKGAVLGAVLGGLAALLLVLAVKLARRRRVRSDSRRAAINFPEASQWDSDDRW